MKTILRLCLLGLCIGFGSAPAWSAQLVVNTDGILTGAKNVIVDGKLYDVEFVDGTCIALFAGCDSTADFTFTGASESLASTALLDQVLVDDPLLGAFDSSPALTAGCLDTTTYCRIETPYEVYTDDFSTLVFNAGSANNFRTDQDHFSGGNTFRRDFDITHLSAVQDGSQDVFARWTAVTTVPEPGTLPSVAVGLSIAALAVALVQRRRLLPRRRTQ